MVTLANLSDTSHSARRLMERGLSPAAADRLAPLFTQAAEAVRGAGAGGNQDAHAFFVPGRIEVLGKHTDYMEGSSLTCAVERGFCLVAAPKAGRTLRITRARAGESVEVELRPGLEPPAGHWTTYPLTVVRRAMADFEGAFGGGHVAFLSNLPQAAGMSSSSAMVVAFFLALRALSGLASRPIYQAHLGSPETLAEYLGAVESGRPFGPFAESEGVGTFGGSEDHTAILCSAPDELRWFSYAPTRLKEGLSLPPGYVFLIAGSGVVAQKTAAARERYNRAALLAQRVMEAWREESGHQDVRFGAAVAEASFSAKRMEKALAQSGGRFEAAALVRRFRHFYQEERQILPAAIEALRKGDLESFGAQADRSQRAAEELLGNQVPETVFLTREARRLGAVAASAFGAGFGGSVWALVHEDAAPALRDAWAERYAAAFPEPARSARFFAEWPGPAAFQL